MGLREDDGGRCARGGHPVRAHGRVYAHGRRTAGPAEMKTHSSMQTILPPYQHWLPTRCGRWVLTGRVSEDPTCLRCIRAVARLLAAVAAEAAESATEVLR